MAAQRPHVHLPLGDRKRDRKRHTGHKSLLLSKGGEFKTRWYALRPVIIQSGANGILQLWGQQYPTHNIATLWTTRTKSLMLKVRI